jgi:phosphatidylinositol glycan class B
MAQQSSRSSPLPFTISFTHILFLRLINALTIATFFQPDEFFQSLEPAWQLAFGQDSGAWLTWVCLLQLVFSKYLLTRSRNGTTNSAHRYIQCSLQSRIWPLRRHLSSSIYPRSCAQVFSSQPQRLCRVSLLRLVIGIHSSWLLLSMEQIT